MSAIKNLVSEIVDYAGLFPPAQLPIENVIANFQQYLDSDLSWMLSRLVLPMGKIDDLEQHEIFVNSNHYWKLSVLIPPVSEHDAFDSALKTISKFNERHAVDQKAIIDNVEVRCPTVEVIKETSRRIPEGLQAFLEIPHHEDPASLIGHVAELGRPNIFAKIRTGGVTTDLIPSASDVANFISFCGQQDVGMKATAGLHHPLRGEYRLTYEDDPDCGKMFGFLNVFIAGCFAYSGRHQTEFLESVLSVEQSESFQVSPEQIEFQGESISAEKITQIRRSRLTTFGSCSFTEPTEELAEMGWLENPITN